MQIVVDVGKAFEVCITIVRSPKYTPVQTEVLHCSGQVSLPEMLIVLCGKSRHNTVWITVKSQQPTGVIHLLRTAEGTACEPSIQLAFPFS